MALETDVIDIPLTGGLAEHVDAKLVEPGSFLTLQNVEYTAAGGLRKRPGYGTLPTTATDTYTVPAPLALDTVGNELVLVGNRPSDSLEYEAIPYLWSWSSVLSKWSPRSSVCPLTIKRRAAIRSFRDLASSTPNVAMSPSGIELWCWAENGNTYYRVRDSVTGAVLVDKAVVLTGFTSFCLFWSGTAFTLIYIDRTDLNRHRFDPSALTWSAVATVYTAAANIVSADVTPIATSDYWVFSFYDSVAVAIRTLRVYCPTPAVTHNVTVATGVACTFTAVAASSDRVTIAWVDAGLNIYAYQVNASALATSWVPILCDTMTGNVVRFTAGMELDNSTHVVWSAQIAATPTFGTVTRAFDNTGTFLGASRRLFHQSPASRPWRAPDGNLYVLTTGYFAASGLTRSGVGWSVLCLTQHNETGYATRPIKLVGHVANIDGDRLSYGVFPHPATGTSSHEATFAIGVVFDLSGYVTIDAITLGASTGAEGLWRSAYASGLLLHSGALLGAYDSAAVVESGFVHPPIWDQTGYALTYQASGVEGDAVLTHTYEYVAIYRWRDAKGLIHQSRPSAPLLVPISNGGGFNYASVALTIYTSGLTRRMDRNDGSGDVAIIVYRSLKNTTGAHYQLLWATTYINSSNNYTVTVTDTETDAVLVAAARGQLYTDGGVFDNDMPPPSVFTHAHGGRLWIVSSEDDREVWASKLLVKDEAPAFSAYLRVRIEDSASEVVALGSLNDELVIFTRDHVYLLSGPGVNDAGGGIPFEQPRLVSSSTGCLDARSVVSWQGGVFFQSKEGLSLVSGGGISWAGQAAKDTLRAYPNIRHAQLDAKRRRITWLCDDGTNGITLWYDYQHNAWGTFVMASDPRSICETVWNNLRVVGDNDGAHLESYGSYPGRDPNQAWITARIDTPWIRLGAVGGFQRVKRVVITGDTLGSHALTLSLYNDWNTSAVQTEAITQTTSLTGPERCVLVVADQKCSAVKIRLQDSAGALNSDSPAGTWLSGISLQIGRKQGVAKLAPGSWKLWAFGTP